MKKITTIKRFGEFEEKLSTASSRADLFADTGFKAEFFSLLDYKLPHEKAVLSLDVFDTLLIRDNSSELTRFIEIGIEMARLLEGSATASFQDGGKSQLPSKSAVDAFLARHLGTKATYRARDRIKGCGEGSLTEIHTVASRLLAGTDRYKDQFIECELAYEVTRLKPNRLLVDYINYHLERGGKVVLVTDMYMHDFQVRDLLVRMEIDHAMYLPIISSADTCVSKASGLIFQEVEAKLGAESDQFLHIGDSLLGDFRQPIRHGWRALHLPVSETEIKLRKADHRASATMLQEKFSIQVDIALPA